MKRLQEYQVFWGPEGREIARVKAPNDKAARRLAPYPYREYLGELYTIEVLPSIPEDVLESA